MPGKPENGSLILLVESAKGSLVPLRELTVEILVITVRFFHGSGRGIQLSSYSSLRSTRKTIQYLLVAGRINGPKPGNALFTCVWESHLGRVWAGRPTRLRVQSVSCN